MKQKLQFLLLLLLLLTGSGYNSYAQPLSAVDIMPGGLNTFTDFEFLDSLHGYVRGLGGSNGLAYTSDAGASWIYRSTPPGGGSIQLVGPLELYLLANTNVYRTVDGGQSWTSLGAVGASSSGSLRDIQFLDSLNGYVGIGVGNAAYQLHKTTNGGQTWISLPTVHSSEGGGGSWTRLEGKGGHFHFMDPDHGFAQVGDSSGYGHLVETTNGGQTWDTIGPTMLTNFEFLNDSIGFLGFEYKTADAGATWDTIAYPYVSIFVSRYNEAEGASVGYCGFGPNGPQGGVSGTVGTFSNEGDSLVAYYGVCAAKVQSIGRYVSYAGGMTYGDAFSEFAGLYRLKGVPVAVDEAHSFALEVYPNPSEGVFSIRSESGPIDRITVWNLEGKQVLEAKPSVNAHQMDLQEKGRGMYFLQVEVNGELRSLKVVVK